MAIADTSRLIISTWQSPIVVGIALDVLERWLVQLFHYTKIERVLLLPLESTKCNTSHLPNTARATSFTLGKERTQHSQPIGNKEY